MARQEFPALGFDPAPGDPGALLAAAGSVGRAGQTFATASSDVDRLRSSGWTGKAANAFRGRLADLPRDLDLAARSHQAAQRALADLGSGLSARQVRAGQLEARAAEARRLRAAAVADVDVLASRRAPEGSAELSALRSEHAAATARVEAWSAELGQVLTDARRLQEEHRSAAQAAAREIRGASEPPYERPGWLSRARDAVATWIRGHADVLTEISTLLKGVSTVLGVLSLVPGLQFLAPFATLAAGAALLVDVGVNAATGRGSWTAIGLDAALTFMPWARVAALVRRAPGAARALDAAGDLVGRMRGAPRGANASLDLPPPGPRRGWPTDPRTGAPLTERDLDFLQWRPEHWMRGEAPLSMTPAVYREWRSSLLDVLQREGVPTDAVDIRLVGSGSEGFSGPRKPMWRADDPALAGNPRAQARLADWVGDSPDRLGSRPFDSGYRLGVEDPSDYDVNISSDSMVARARELWEERGRPGDFFHGSHEYVNKDIAADAFPQVEAWRHEWAERLGPREGVGRDVSWAIFRSSGPKDDSAAGFFVHFRDDYDWIVHRPRKGG